MADGAHSSVDILRASDHVRIAAMPTAVLPYGVAAARNGKRVYVSTYDGKNLSFGAERKLVIAVP